MITLKVIQRDPHGKKLSVFPTVGYTRTRQGLGIFFFLSADKKEKDKISEF